MVPTALGYTDQRQTTLAIDKGSFTSCQIFFCLSQFLVDF